MDPRRPPQLSVYRSRPVVWTVTILVYLRTHANFVEEFLHSRISQMPSAQLVEWISPILVNARTNASGVTFGAKWRSNDSPFGVRSF
jgi:hypothetical protein